MRKLKTKKSAMSMVDRAKLAVVRGGDDPVDPSLITVTYKDIGIFN